jgi:hypothetical protein
VSLPSLPSFNDRSGFIAGLPPDLRSLGALLLEGLEGAGVEGCTDLVYDGRLAPFLADLEVEGVGLAWQLISDLRSQ